LLSVFFKERGGRGSAVKRGSRPREEEEHRRAARGRTPSKSWRYILRSLSLHPPRGNN